MCNVLKGYFAERVCSKGEILWYTVCQPVVLEHVSIEGTQPMQLNVRFKVRFLLVMCRESSCLRLGCQNRA